MKSFKSITRSWALASLALLLTSVSTQAISIWAEVYVRDTWVRVIPNSNTGGAVIWDNSVGWYTDRVSRGEVAAISCCATTAGEIGQDRGYTTTCGTERFGPFPFNSVTLQPKRTYGQFFTVPTNPQCYNLRIWVKSSLERKEINVPLGSR